MSSSLEQLLERTVGGLGYELADFEYANKGSMLRIFIDKLHEVTGEAGTVAGITLNDCERVIRQLQRVLPVEGIEYGRMEVSSPGLDRRLRKPEHFVRFAGHEVEVRLRVPVNGRRKLVGTLGVLSGEQLEMDVDGGKFLVELPNVEKARLVPKI